MMSTTSDMDTVFASPANAVLEPWVDGDVDAASSSLDSLAVLATADAASALDSGESCGAFGRNGEIGALKQRLQRLHAEASALTAGAVRRAEEERALELRQMGQRVVAEQERLFQTLVEAMPSAVLDAAREGRRTAVLLNFEGADKFGDFCYLYLLKGPRVRNEMYEIGASPLLNRLRSLLRCAGFCVHHAWQRATNENTLAVSW